MCVSIHVSHIVCATHWCVISDTCMMMDEHIVADSTDGFSTISQSKENNSLCRWVISEIFRIYAYVGTRNGSLEDCRTPQSKIFVCDRNWLFDCKSCRQVIWWHSVLSYLTIFLMLLENICTLDVRIFSLSWYFVCSCQRHDIHWIFCSWHVTLVSLPIDHPLLWKRSRSR